MFDSGGSSGLLRREFGYPPLGDLRQCLLALCDGEQATRALREVFEFRFPGESSLNGHSLGNLLLAALTTLRNDIEAAIKEMSRLLGVRGEVIPVSLKTADLCAELEDGRCLRGEVNIDVRREALPRIRRVFLEPEVEANPRAVEAILKADAVVLGPGDLYTSVIPNLLPSGIPEAIAHSQARTIYVCNLMTKLGETGGFKASDFVREIVRYLGGTHLDWAMVNTQAIPGEIRQKYVVERAYSVESDVERAQECAGAVFGGPLGNNQQPLRHDPIATAEAILSIIGCGRGTNGYLDDIRQRDPTRPTTPLIG